MARDAATRLRLIPSGSWLPDPGDRMVGVVGALGVAATSAVFAVATTFAAVPASDGTFTACMLDDVGSIR